LHRNKRLNGLKEDVDMTTTTLLGERAQGEGLAVWHEEGLRLANCDTAVHRSRLSVIHKEQIVQTSTSSTGTTVQPHGARHRKGLGIWTGQVLLGLVITLVALATSGAIYQAVATALDQRTYPPPGKLVDVGGYKLHISCTGEGSPTVILDHVGAASSAQRGLVQPEIAKTTRVCAYDRAGFGWSDPGPAPRDAQHNMDELHALLDKAGIPGPYVLVGHSFGANVARLYVAAYPHEIGGIVLVDPGIQFDTPGVPVNVNAAWKEADQTIMRAGPYLSRLGIFRLSAALGAAPGHGDLPAASSAAFDAMNLTTKFWDTLSAQNAAIPATSSEVLRASQNLGALPLIVLSASQLADESRQVWTQVNSALAARSSNGIHRVVVGATHISLHSIKLRPRRRSMRLAR
jgi:pimeloyl-ACP methyl ester carboxylesterase